MPGFSLIARGRRTLLLSSVLGFGGCFAWESRHGAWADEQPLPAEVVEAIEKLPADRDKAIIVRESGHPWLVAVGWGRAAPQVVPGMEQDNATRAAVEVAKNEAARLLAAEIAVFMATTRSQAGEETFSREVIVAVSGEVLAGVELHDFRYDSETRRCRAVILCPPPSDDDRAIRVFPDVEAAAGALLEKASKGLCGMGVICVAVEGEAAGRSRMAAISIAAAPRSRPGGHQIGQAKGQAALLRFLSEAIASRESLRTDSVTVADPFDPDGSALLHREHFEKFVQVKRSGVLPPTKSLTREVGPVLYTATWFVDAAR